MGEDSIGRKEEKTDQMMRSKKRAFRRDWKAQITRSARRSSVLKSIHRIHAQGLQVLTPHPPPP